MLPREFSDPRQIRHYRHKLVADRSRVRHRPCNALKGILPGRTGTALKVLEPLFQCPPPRLGGVGPVPHGIGPVFRARQSMLNSG